MLPYQDPVILELLEAWRPLRDNRIRKRLFWGRSLSIMGERNVQ